MSFHGEFPQLREFQVATHEAIRQAARERHKRILIMAPTGAGKTILALNVIRETLTKGRRAMFLCDRKTLIAQTSNVARDVGLSYHGIIQADNPMLDLSRPFQVASCQTLMRRGWPDTDVLVVDECHTMYKTWVDYVKSQDCKAFVIGLSATPFSRGLGKIFTKHVNAATMSELTDQGILVPMRIFSCRRPDMTGAETSGGEWTDKAAEERELVLVGDVVSRWMERASDRKTIIFGATIRHCEEIAQRFREAGVTTAVFTADTKDEERRHILTGFTCGEIRILVSVEALAKGFDVKDVGAICDCRPLRKSLSTAIQMWGRGLRSSPETGKCDCLLLDFSGNIIRFMPDFERFYFEGLDKLDDGEKLDREIRQDEDKEPRACPSCGHVPFFKKCIKCGFESTPKALVEERSGLMQEIRLGKKVLAADHADLWAQLATYAKTHSAPEKQQGRAAHLYRDIVGQWPPSGFRVETAPHVEPTRATANKIRSLNIAFSKGRAA